MGHLGGHGQRARRFYRASGSARNRIDPDTTAGIGVWPPALPGLIVSRYAHRTPSPDGARGYVSQGRREARLHLDCLEQRGRAVGTLLCGNHSMNEEAQIAKATNLRGDSASSNCYSKNTWETLVCRTPKSSRQSLARSAHES
jgi:hypothetical protein